MNILNEAAAMCCEMQKYIPDFRMNVNVSYVQIPVTVHRLGSKIPIHFHVTWIHITDTMKIRISCSKIITMVHSINVRICAEGIEEKEWLLKMKEMKVDYLQGYYLGRPCGKKQFLQQYASGINIK